MEIFNTEKRDLSGITEYVKVEDFAKSLNLNVIFEGRGGFDLTSISVSRPGLQLTGYFTHFNHERIQLIGNAEHDYLRSMPENARERNLDELFRREIPCIIFANNLEILPSVLKYAQKYNCPVFSSTQITTVLAHELTMYQSELLAPRTVMHGVLVEVFGVGILLTGKAGIGKSETALELITRGHRLVADDSVVIKNIGENITGKSPEKIQYFMEVRGIGIINVRTMYGQSSIRPAKTIDIVVELVKWDDTKEYDRLGDIKDTTEILGIEKPKLTIPVSANRNIPAIIETAARKYRLDEAGYDATKELLSRTFN